MLAGRLIVDLVGWPVAGRLVVELAGWVFGAGWLVGRQPFAAVGC